MTGINNPAGPWNYNSYENIDIEAIEEVLTNYYTKYPEYDQFGYLQDNMISAKQTIKQFKLYNKCKKKIDKKQI